MFIDDLMLLSGHDIPFPEAELMIHPLTPDDIAYITEIIDVMTMLSLINLSMQATAIYPSTKPRLSD